MRAFSNHDRQERRVKAREKFLRKIAKEREVGVDPIFHHGSYSDLQAARKSWAARCAAYDEAHPA